MFILKISKEIGKAWCKSLKREARASQARKACEAREKWRLSQVSLSVFSLVPDLSFHGSRVLEYAKIRTVLQSTQDDDSPFLLLNLDLVLGFRRKSIRGKFANI